MKALDYEDERVSSDVATRLDEHAPILFILLGKIE